MLLLIDVSNSTLKRDRDRKAQIYAHAGISEYWIVNINKRQVIVLQNPQGDEYQLEQTFSENDQLIPLCCPDICVDLRYLII